MRKMIKVALICASAMAGVTAAEAMPVDGMPAAAKLGTSGAQIEKTAIVVLRRRPVRRVIRRRPAIIIR